MVCGPAFELNLILASSLLHFLGLPHSFPPLACLTGLITLWPVRSPAFPAVTNSSVYGTRSFVKQDFPFKTRKVQEKPE